MSFTLETVELPIQGMTCNHCVGTVRKALEAVPGVRSAAVTLKPGRATVEVEPGTADRAGLVAAVSGAGYGVAGTDAVTAATIGPVPAPIPAEEEWHLAVGGMHCASCVGRVEGALRSVPGVRQARVNLATERASVVVDPSRVVEARLSAAVAAAGYDARRAELVPGTGAESLRRERAGHVAYWRNRLAVGVALTVPLVALGYLPPLTRTPAGWVMLPLALGLLLYLGQPYFAGAWARARQGSSNMDTLIALGTLTAFAYSLWHLVSGHPFRAAYLRDVGASAALAGAVIGTALALGRRSRSA